MLIRLTNKARIIVDSEKIEFVVFIGPVDQRKMFVGMSNGTDLITQEKFLDEEMDYVFDEICLKLGILT